MQIWPSGQVSGLESQTPGVPGSIPGVCSKLSVSGAAQRLLPRENRPFPKLHRGTLDVYHFLTIFDDFW